MIAIDSPGIYQITKQVYHEDPCPKPSLSATIAKVLYERSPAHAVLLHPRLRTEDVEVKSSRIMELGTAAHAVILENKWDSISIIDAPDFRTKEAREKRDGALFMGLTPILERESDVLHGMVDAMRRSEALPVDLDLVKLGAEQTIVWQEGDQWCRARYDFLHSTPGGEVIYDLKTTGIAANARGWGRKQIWEYAMQHGFYRRGLMNLKHTPPIFRFIVQETSPPYAVATFDLDPAGYEYADFIAFGAVVLWGQCMRAAVEVPSRDAWLPYPAGLTLMETPYYIREQLEGFIRKEG